MDTLQLVERIIAGSQAVDRMRAEIDLVVKTILGFISGEEFDQAKGPHQDYISFSHRDDCWSVWKDGRLYVGFWLQEEGVRIYHSGYGIPLAYVKVVHQHLPLFVIGMVKAFPHLEGTLHFLVDAAPVP